MDDGLIIEVKHKQGFHDNEERAYDVKAFECDQIGDGDNVSGPCTTWWTDACWPICVDPGQTRI